MHIFRQEASLDNPRQNVLRVMKASVPREIWESNVAFTTRLRKRFAAHKLTCHKALNTLTTGGFGLEELRDTHLDYRHAIVQIFTDALSMAQAQSRQLEPRLPAGSSVAPRFLLTLNALDEYGFRPGLNESGYYRGNPLNAHYPLFESLLDDLGISKAIRMHYSPSSSSLSLRNHLEGAYSTYQSILVLLAVAEEQVILFSPALKRATEILGIDVSQGYYFVHGTSDDDDCSAADDDHEEDLWNALHQALHPEMYARLECEAMEYLDLWCQFWDEQLYRLSSSCVSISLVSEG